MIRFGTAGWDYKDWTGVVYPKRSPRGFDRLGYLAGFFDTIEINATFYRPMPAELAPSWAERVRHNPRFRFTLKLWRRFTHERQAAWSADEVLQARALPEALRRSGRLGAVLLQFPWSFKRTTANEQWLQDLISELSDLPLVLEVRHVSWNTAQLYTTLMERGVGIVNIDQPLFHNSIRPGSRITSPTGYIRVHGRNYRNWFRKNAGRDARYDYLYKAQELSPWAERARELQQHPVTEDVYVVTNNHFRGQAAANALMLKSMVEQRPVDAPPELVAAYPQALTPFVTRPRPPAPVQGELRLD